MQKEYLPQNLQILKTEHFLKIELPYIICLCSFGSFPKTMEKSSGMVSNKHSTLDHVPKFKDIDFILRKQKVLCYKVIVNLGFEG